MFCSESLSSDWGSCRGDRGAGALYQESVNKPFVLFGVLHGSIGENCDLPPKLW